MRVAKGTKDPVYGINTTLEFARMVIRNGLQNNGFSGKAKPCAEEVIERIDDHLRTFRIKESGGDTHNQEVAKALLSATKILLGIAAIANVKGLPKAVAKLAEKILEILEK